MRILIITEEDEFYLPFSIDYILRNIKTEVVEVVCARNPLLPSKFKAACKFYKSFGLKPVLLQAFRLLRAKLQDTIPCLNRSDRQYSVRRTCKAHGVTYLHCDNINSDDFLQHCRELAIDLIASVSPTQIFKEKLITLPKYGCINIHTAKLPKYRGLYPTYWAMSSGETTIGISVHYIEKGIDTGKIIMQDEVEVPGSTTLDNMLRVTKIKGAELLIEAVGQIETGTVRPFYPEGDGSYFSFPTWESYKDFRGRGYKLW